ncbi:CoA transferase [uncultured Parasphingorhabdus sp.]|mgnify:FL=1|uniref:CaiB/BaiF CoA transferase family protein n=1 Tax=uncultured Parasphingorhabdus sp. TaxID=2709694 RepID=UPI0030D7FD44|tara:strand:- start:36798 stop:37961 length:1164 start_codon:yes stop_codon:yes gene_type:complete
MTEITSTQPLAGIRVIEFSTMVTASLATMMFAQQGADVIKVEPPGIGDPMRWLGSQKSGISGLFHNCNRAKRSITLDLKTEEGVAHARQLCLSADVVIHNYRPGVMDRLGLGSEALRQEKPELVYCAITGFGHEGPLSGRPAYDHVMQAMAGFMTLQGHPEGFAYVKTLICDKITAYTAAQAITAALFARERIGIGQHIDLSMLESCIAFLWPDGGMHLTLQADDVTHGAPFADYYQLPLRSTDGAIAYAAMTDDHWAAIFDIVGRPDLKTEEKYKGMANRSVHMAELASIIAAQKPDLTSAEMVTGLAARDVPAAPCVALEDLPANQQAMAVGIFEQSDHPLLGPVRHVTSPARFGGTKPTPCGPSPALGEHSEAILAELAAPTQA